VPGIVEQTLIRSPASQMGPIAAEERAAALAASDFGTRYDASFDPQSAYEILAKRADAAEKAESKALFKALQGTTGRRIVRGVLGGLFKGR